MSDFPAVLPHHELVPIVENAWYLQGSVDSLPHPGLTLFTFERTNNSEAALRPPWRGCSAPERHRMARTRVAARPYMPSASRFRASMSANPSLFSPRHISGWVACGSSCPMPMPQMRSRGDASTRTRLPVASRNARRCSF